MNKDEALRLALEALENSVDLVRENAYNAEELYGNYPARQGKVRGLKVLADDHEKSITAIKAALEAKDEIDWKDMYEKQKRHSEMWVAKYEKDIGPLEKAVPQKEAKDEPVEFFDWYDNAHWGNEDFKEGCHRAWNAAIKYTTPPQRTWVGLTDEDIALIDWESLITRKDCVNSIEAKLKAKNT